MARYLYRVSGRVSVAMRIPEWGYPLHGHDVEVSACFASERRVDLELLYHALEAELSKIDHRPLWEALEGRGSTLEDLAEWLLSRLRSSAGARLVCVEASIPGRSVRVDA